MRIRHFIRLIIFVLAAPLALAQAGAPVPPTEEPSPAPKEDIGYADALVLGLVEGITEYLPVSSTGHLILTNRLLGLDTPTVLADASGAPILRDGEPLTLEDVANAYAIIIQAGAIAAVVLLYWGRLIDMLRGVLGQSRTGLLLLRNLIAAFLPAAFLGLLLDDWIESVLFGPGPVVAALVGGGLLMLGVEARRKKRGVADEETVGPDLHEITIRQALVVGLLQCVAMWPGTSRSMMTIVGGYVIGLSPRRAAEFSFLLGLVTLSAASGYKALTLGPAMLKTLDPGPSLFGIAVAFVSAALAVKWLVGYLSRHGLALFAWYRFALAAAVIAYLAL